MRDKIRNGILFIISYAVQYRKHLKNHNIQRPQKYIVHQ